MGWKTEEIIFDQRSCWCEAIILYKRGDTLIFASEIKGLFAYPGVKPVINREGLCEIFGLGPAKSYGKGVFKDIYEVLPGHFLEYDREGLKDRAYWELKAKEHTEQRKRYDRAYKVASKRCRGNADVIRYSNQYIFIRWS